MIISPPFLRAHSDAESDEAWVQNMMPVDGQRGFPVNRHGAWHGGIHIPHTDSSAKPEKIRAIADGIVVFVRTPSPTAKRDGEPLNYNGPTDDGCVVLKHKTEIGSGDNAKVTFYSLYMHLNFLESGVSSGKNVTRKSPLGTTGMVDGSNGIHMQIFCEDPEVEKLTGRTDEKLDISKNGRLDAVYGDMHFYLPPGTPFYQKAPGIRERILRDAPVYSSTTPLYITMQLGKGSCVMTTRGDTQEEHGIYPIIGGVTESGYEYHLYKTAKKLSPETNQSGAYELLRFGRIVDTDYETLPEADLPHWRKVAYPGGEGWVNSSDMATLKVSGDA